MSGGIVGELAPLNNIAAFSGTPGNPLAGFWASQYGDSQKPRSCGGNPMFHGSITALITPFKNGGVDEKGFQAFVEWQVAEGSNGVVPVGTTGESPTLSHEEHKRVVELCVEAADGRMPVIAGTGSNSTAEAIELEQARRRRRAPTRRWSSRPITTSRPRKGCISTSRRWQKRRISRSWSTTFPAARSSTSASTPWRGWRRSRTSSASRTRPTTWRGRCARASSWARILPALGRGRDRRGLPGAGRRGLHLRHLERRAETVRRTARGLARAGLRRPSTGSATA